MFWNRKYLHIYVYKWMDINGMEVSVANWYVLSTSVLMLETVLELNNKIILKTQDLPQFTYLVAMK